MCIRDSHQAAHVPPADQDLYYNIGCDDDTVCNQIASCCFIYLQTFRLSTFSHDPHLHFLVNLLAQNTGRLYKKHNDQDCENNGVGKLGRNIGLA